MSQHNNYPTQYPQQQCYQSQPASQPASQSQQTTQTTQYTQQYHDQYPQHLQQTQIEYMPISSSIYENYAIPYNNNNSQAIPSSISSNSSQQNLLASQLQPEEDYFFVGVIKVAKDDLTTLWNALTLFSATLNTSNNAILERSEESKDSEGHYYKDISFGVIGSSSYLMGLSGDSRRWTKSFLLKQNNKMMY
ncbi:13148_t:CDS:2 [Entrophospora sp. SA101]|nr:13148_t:CDS:2 [Entrophospora sp. SA101]